MTDLNRLSLDELFAALTADGLLTRAFALARDEDLGPRGLEGDVTSVSMISEDAAGSAVVVARREGVVAGLVAVPLLIQIFGGRVEWRPAAQDGARISRGGALGRIAGPSRALLALERTLLNVLGRACGVATAARAYVDAVAGTSALICDTRKTMPGLRAMDKYAVRCGGGHLHRVALHDAALYKDNHLAGVALADLPGRIAAAAATARTSAPDGLRFIEVEADSLEQLGALLSLPAGTIDIVLLDNMPPAQLRQGVAARDARNPRLLLEASGGITLANVRAIAETGVDRISIGAITHSAPGFDVGLDWE